MWEQLVLSSHYASQEDAEKQRELAERGNLSKVSQIKKNIRNNNNIQMGNTKPHGATKISTKCEREKGEGEGEWEWGRGRQEVRVEWVSGRVVLLSSSAISP